MSIATLPLTNLGSAAAAVVEKLEPKKEQFAPGIYFGLDEDVYHADPALGSTDMRRLARDARVFWWESRFNPNRDELEEEETSQARETKMVGRALHAAVLEGRDVLEARYAPAYSPGNVKAGIEERRAIGTAGKTAIKFKYWKRILIASSIVRNDPECGDAFHNTIATELSIFWICQRSGIRKKARIDAAKPRSIVDFKSITNRDDIPFEELCCRHIGSYGYFTQAECYRDAWAQIPALIDAGAVFMAPSREHVERLRRAATNDLTAFTFIFLQKTGAPLVWGTTISPGNGILDNARDEISIAESNWREYVEMFGGVDTPWIRSRPLTELDINDVPAWSFRRRY